jgi:GNAT superfamily N-acetyltransferase
MEIDRARLDALEQHLWADIWEAAPRDLAAAHGVEMRRFGAVQVTLIADLPRAGWQNLVLGAAAPGAVAEGHLAEAVAWADSRGVDYYVPVTPGLPDSEAAEEWLEGSGYERGYAWMKFLRDAATPEPAQQPHEPEVVELAAGEGGDFGAIVAAGFELPDWAGPLYADLPGRAGWRCYVARGEGRSVACAAMLVDEPAGVAEFGLAATLEAARGRGCQSALLRRRIADAAAAGCRILFVETGERVDGRPAASYRNILRAGFEEAYLRPNWKRAAA